MDKNKIYRDYKNETNMSCMRFMNWSKRPCSFNASLDRRPIKRNLKLLCNPKKKWTDRDYKEAQKSISYLRRAKKIKSRNIVHGCEKTKNEIALKNWGYETQK